MVRAREERKSRALVVTGEGREGNKDLLVFWDRDGVRLGGKMTPCGGRTEECGWGDRTSNGRRGGWGGFNKCMQQ